MKIYVTCEKVYKVLYNREWHDLKQQLNKKSKAKTSKDVSFSDTRLRSVNNTVVTFCLQSRFW